MTEYTVMKYSVTNLQLLTEEGQVVILAQGIPWFLVTPAVVWTEIFHLFR